MMGLTKNYTIIFRNACLTTVFTFLLLSFSTALAQENDWNKVEIIESLNDSIDLASNFYEVEDTLNGIFPGFDIYDDWDNEGISGARVDMSAKTDTTMLVLCDRITNFYVHPCKNKINSEFGHRRRRFHYGIDIDLEIGDSVKSAFDGKVRVSKYTKGYGNVIVVRHFNGLETVYAHLSMARVRQNDLVKAGELIGYGGNTGRSTGPHLHFEVRYLGTPMNPRKVINFENYCLHSDTLLITRYTFEKKSMKPGVNPNLTAAKTGGQTHQSSGTTTYSGNKTYHYVRKGETLSHIAVKYNTSVTSLCKLNGLTSKSILQIGQKIRVR